MNLKSTDLTLVDNTLTVLSTFMQGVFNKNFLSPSSDLIAVFAGLESIDGVFFDLLDNLSSIIKQKHSPEDPHSSFILSIQVNSIRSATIAAGGAYQTSLASYFTNRDIFGSIMSFVDMQGTEEYVGDAFTLLGILASYDKLEALNPYRTRLADSIDRHGMLKSIQASGHVWQVCFEKYLTLINDGQGTPPSYQGNSGISAYNSVAYWIGMGQTAGSQNKLQIDSLPLEIISLTLATYEFLNVNNLYAKLLLECPTSNSKILTSSNPPFANFLSHCTYLFQNQHKTPRAALYARLNLLILRLLVEAPQSSSVPDLLLSDEHRTKGISVCQQRAPNIPVVNSPNGRLLIEGVLDALQCAIRFNMKRSLDVEMYILSFTVLFQTLHLLRQAQFGLEYHWSQLWKSIMSLLRFINSHPPVHPQSSSGGSSSPSDAGSGSSAHVGYVALGRLITLVLASALIHGDLIFSESAQYDDLLYKVMECSQDLDKFCLLFPALIASPSMSVLKAAVSHYSNLLKVSTTSQQQAKPSFFSFKSAATPPRPLTSNPGTNSKALASDELTPKKVAEIIRQGYQTLSLHQHVTKGNNSGISSTPTKGSDIDQSQASYLLYDALPKYNESQERLFLKHMSRQVIADVQQLHSKLT